MEASPGDVHDVGELERAVTATLCDSPCVKAWTTAKMVVPAPKADRAKDRRSSHAFETTPVRSARCPHPRRSPFLYPWELGARRPVFEHQPALLCGAAHDDGAFALRRAR
jgi:hypothetical protein